MAITIDWLTAEQNILVLTYAEPWTWEQVRLCAQSAADMLDSVQQPVYFVHNFYGNTYMPPGGFVENTRWIAASLHSHPNIAAVITVVSPDIQPLFIPALQRYGAPGREYLFAETLDMALGLIRKRSA